MSAKVHIHMHVSDLDKSRAFYRAFFGAEPVKEKPGYAKFLPEWGPVNLALSEGGGPGTGPGRSRAPAGPGGRPAPDDDPAREPRPADGEVGGRLLLPIRGDPSWLLMTSRKW